eukprot:5550319-Amphidinium_carterae.2
MIQSRECTCELDMSRLGGWGLLGQGKGKSFANFHRLQLLTCGCNTEALGSGTMTSFPSQLKC